MSAPLEPVPGRVPPSDLDAEAAVLSACLLEPQTIDDVREIIVPLDMYAGANQRILKVIFELQDAGREVDIVAVAGVLRDTNRLDQIGGTPYLALLADATPAVAHVADHARRVKEKARLRAMISECQRIAAEGYGDVGPVRDWLESAQKSVDAAAGDLREQKPTAILYGEAARQAYQVIYDAAKSGATMIGYPTGFDEMDNHVGGLAAGDLWIVGGYPGIGKTSVVKQIAEHVGLARTKSGARVGVPFFSLEMKTTQLMMRSMARRAQLPLSNVRIGRLLPVQWQTLHAAYKAASDVAMMLDDQRGLTPYLLRRRIRQMLAVLRNEFGSDTELGLVPIDYIQLMRPNVASNNRSEELGSISKELKDMAGEFNCAFIALSSLNRPKEKARPKSPGMADLRESGALEFDADVILMVHRDDPYKEKSEAPDHIAELSIVKGRNSGTSRHDVSFDGRYTAFYPLGMAPIQREQQQLGHWQD